MYTRKNQSDYWRPFVEIIGRGKPSYMIRVHLTPYRWWKWRRVYIHIMGRPDSDRDFHDHPWSFWTIVLFGGYSEASHVISDMGRPTGEFRHDSLGFLSVRYRPATHAHKITRLHTRRVITMVLRSNTKNREWGFWKYDGYNSKTRKNWWRWIPWREYHGVEP